MRTLQFSETDKEKYDLIYEAFAMTERPMRGADLRVCAKVFDKLETLGKYSDSKLNRNLFVFNDIAGFIKLEEPEYNLLVDSLKNVTWNSVGARKASPIIDWLEGIKED